MEGDFPGSLDWDDSEGGGDYSEFFLNEGEESLEGLGLARF